MIPGPMNELKRLFAMSGAYRRRFYVGLACAGLAALFPMAMTQAVEFILDLFERARILEERGELRGRLLWIGLLLPVGALLKGASLYGATYLIGERL